jgi:hypothetical protein
MKTESRSVVDPEDREEEVQWTCSRGDLSDPSIYHPEGYSYGDRYMPTVFYPEFRVEFEKHTPNSDSGRKVWHSYEHYLVRRNRPTPVALPLYDSCPPVGAPHFEKAVFHNPRFAMGQNPTASIRADLFGYEAGDFPLGGLFKHYDERPDGGFIPEPAHRGVLEERAMSYLWPVVKAELSAVNSLLELKDFKSLPSTLKKIESGLYRIYNRVYERLRYIFKSSADGYLQAKFNILPLLSDISGIHAALSSAERRINALVAGAGRPRTGHWSTTLVESDDDLNTQSTDPFDPIWARGGLSYYVIRRHTQTLPTKFHVEMQYNYLFSAYQTVHAQLLGHLDAFGVNLNPAIIWNAIPWSFVVDWVIGVGRWLDGLKVHNLEPRVNIRRYCWSVTRERRTDTWREHRPLYPGHPLYAVPVETAPCPLTLERSYRREIGLPSTSSMTSSGLNPTEVSLGAALVISRRRRNRNRLRKF